MNKVLAPILAVLLASCSTGSMPQYDEHAKSVVALIEGPLNDPDGGATGTMVGHGLILTARHVVEDMKAGLQAVTLDGKSFKLTVVWTSDTSDLALLKATDEPADEPQNTNLAVEKTTIGEPVWTIGMPGLDPRWSFFWGNVSIGVPLHFPAGEGVSYLNDPSFIYTTMEGIAGMSGGPVFAPDGKIIGVNSLSIFHKDAFTLLTQECLDAIKANSQ